MVLCAFFCFTLYYQWFGPHKFKVMTTQTTTVGSGKRKYTIFNLKWCGKQILKRKVFFFFFGVITDLLFIFRKINQYQYILFLLSNSLRVDVKILKSFVVLSLRSPCFQYICRCFSFQNWLFTLKTFCGTFFGGSKLLILMELREKYMTLDQHTLVGIWHLVSVNNADHRVNLSILQSDCLLPLMPQNCHGSWSPASCLLLLPSHNNCIYFMWLLSLGSVSRTVHPMIWNVPWVHTPWNTNSSPSRLE